MPQLQPIVENIQQFFLPSTENAPEADRAWVRLNLARISAADLLAITGGQGTSESNFMAALIANRILEWNFTDPSGQTLPITLETTSWLDPQDYAFIMSKLNSIAQAAGTLGDAEKKA